MDGRTGALVQVATATLPDATWGAASGAQQLVPLAKQPASPNYAPRLRSAFKPGCQAPASGSRNTPRPADTRRATGVHGAPPRGAARLTAHWVVAGSGRPTLVSETTRDHVASSSSEDVMPDADDGPSTRPGARPRLVAVS